jgi:hypothetical protein
VRVHLIVCFVQGSSKSLLHVFRSTSHRGPVVTPVPPLVTQVPPLVTQVPPLVTQVPPLVTSLPMLVMHTQDEHIVYQ